MVAYGNIQERAKANAVVTNFFTYSLEKNKEGLATLYDDKEAATFVEQAAEKVDKSCLESERSYTDTSKGENTTAEVKTNCVIDWKFGLTYSAEKKDWNITELVFNSKGTATNNSSEDEATGTLGCLVAQDAMFFPNNTLSENIYAYFYDDSFFFTSDSTTFQYPDQSKEKIDLFAKFYSEKKDKAFTYRLVGSVNEAAQTSAGKELALRRGETIKTELIEAGVPSDRIVIDEPRSVSNQFIESASRNVSVYVTPSQSCGNTTPSGL